VLLWVLGSSSGHVAMAEPSEYHWAPPLHQAQAGRHVRLVTSTGRHVLFKQLLAEVVKKLVE
jgi:hypothetical protein